MGLTISGSGENGWSYNGKPGYKFHSRNGVAGFMIPGNEFSWVPSKGDVVKNLPGTEVTNSDPFAPVKPPVVPTRDKPAPNGGGGSGTQTSPGGGMPVLDAATAAQFLQTQRIGRGAFSSVQLPGSDSNPITGVVPDAIPFGGQETSVTAGTLGSFTSNGATMPALDDRGFTTQMPDGLVSQYAKYGSMSQGNAAPTSAPGTSRLNEALSDTASMRGPETQEGLMRRANAAFLNAKTSQEGLRAKEAVLGQFHASGQTYQLGTDNKLIQGQTGKPLAMDRDAASSYRLGTSSAQQYKDSYKDKVKEIPAATTPTTPAEAQSPSSINPVPVSKQTISTNLGPMIDDEQYGRQLESFKGMGGVGPVIDNNVYGGFLEGNREPMMRDPRKK